MTVSISQVQSATKLSRSMLHHIFWAAEQLTNIFFFTGSASIRAAHERGQFLIYLLLNFTEYVYGTFSYHKIRRPATRTTAMAWRGQMTSTAVSQNLCPRIIFHHTSQRNVDSRMRETENTWGRTDIKNKYGTIYLWNEISTRLWRVRW